MEPPPQPPAMEPAPVALAAPPTAEPPAPKLVPEPAVAEELSPRACDLPLVPCEAALKPQAPRALKEPAGPLREPAVGSDDEAAPPEIDWPFLCDFVVPDEVQPPLPLPQCYGSRSVTRGKVLAAARHDTGRLFGPRRELCPDRAKLVDRGPLQVRASCSLKLPPRIMDATPRIEDPASGDATDVPRSSRSSLSEGRSSSSSSSDARMQVPLDIDEAQDTLLSWLRSEDFSPPLSPPSAGRVQAAYHEDSPLLQRTPPTRLRLERATLVAPEDPDGDRECYRADALDESTVGPMACSPPLVGRGASTSKTASESRTAASSPSGSRDTFDGAEVYVPLLRRAGLAAHGGGGSGVWPGDRVAPGPGRKAEAAEAAPEAPSVFDFLRRQFADVDVNNKRQFEEAELVDFICGRVSQGLGGDVPEELENLLREAARRCYRQAMVRSRGVRSEDWVHYGLLLASAPSHVGHDLLNRRLRREVTVRPYLLRQILDAFEAADVRGAGVARPGDVEEAFEDGAELLKLMEVADQDQITYYDFAAFCLGCRKSPVVLNWYDVSYGYAQWLPTTALGGQRLKGIWHTGLVAFGKEYWYGGRVLSSEPGNAPFPPGPVRSTHLGYTLRTRDELEDFLRYELVPRYTREKYDVLNHNCNHFSDEAAGFLVQGCHIPDEALMQQEAVMSAPLLEKLRPYLNNWLSGFEASGSDADIDDLMPEWRARLWPGDLALFAPPGNHHEPLLLVQVSNINTWKGTCDITYFESAGSRSDVDLSPSAARNARALRWSACARSGSFWDWRSVSQQAVPLSALRPHTVGGLGHSGTAGSGLSGSIRTHLRVTNPEMQVHLRRKGTVFALCPLGHSMASSRRRRSWSLTSSRTCGVCCRTIQAGEVYLQCPVCAFGLCSRCDNTGLYRGYYSLGSIDAGMAKLLLQETEWIRYKTRRYMSASGVAGGALEMDVWLKRVAPRLFGDLGLPPPSIAELVELYRQYGRTCEQHPGRFVGLSEDEFCDLLFALITAAAVGGAPLVSL